ncbi:polar amino acid transport system permease protein [Maridesulfovibrio ferrireducens]|uniref:Glutamate/aspartate import permease protein GltK n=1 Tax=Maridesulfovibrio ferrireducens TaxID=246191 RepID=A0A1G9JSH6_9BACT|nr:amino acid ABC transporter permease [Maridesulfovibrio ferrireducens]SDL40391.1 polar amino acid transport system permease protein [Maridesulfovibrio ferrireducens]
MITLDNKFGKSGAFLASLFLLLTLLTVTAVSEAGEKSDAILKQARDALSLGHIDQAQVLFEQIPAPGPEGDDGEFVYSRMQLARLNFSLKDLNQAKKYSEEIIAVYPDNIEAKNFIASVDRSMRPQWRQIVDDCLRFLPSLLKGATMTLVLVFFTMLVSPIGGLLIALGKISKVQPFSGISWFIIWFFRGTPLLLQLFFIYYGLPAMGITLSPLVSALIGLGINYSAYLAEIIRAGIQSIDHGQTEAAKALGMTYSQTMRRVIIPQTYKRIIPPFANEFIALIKDTALVSTIAMVELMRAADQMFNAYFNITVLVLAAFIYLIFTTVFTFAFEKLEYKVGVYERR